MFRTRRPQVSDNSEPYETVMIVSVGFLPNANAGAITFPSVVFPCLGGVNDCESLDLAGKKLR